MKKGTKMREVLVKCLNVDPDGHAVNRHGEIANHPREYLYTWETQRRGEKWLKANPKLWKSLGLGRTTRRRPHDDTQALVALVLARCPPSCKR